MTKVLFICTGNIFRSYSADQALRSILPPGSDIQVSSAGTHGQPGKRWREDVQTRLEHWGVDTSKHSPRLLTREMLEDADLVVAMDPFHQKFIEQTFGIRVPLYYDIVDGSGRAFPDLPDVVPDFRSKPDESRVFVNESIDTIFNNREAFLRRLPLFLPPPKAPRVSPPPFRPQP